MGKDKEFLKSCELMDYSLLLVCYQQPEDMSFEESEISEDSLGHTPEKKFGKLDVTPGNN